MGKRIIAGLFALVAAFLVSGIKMPEQVQADAPNYWGSNIDAQSYSVTHHNFADVINSALVETADGQLMRFQADALDDYYLVEYYDTSYNLKKTVKVAKELSLFGAFYDDGTNYYILSGQKNLDEQKTVEVYRLTKYSHKWKRISSVGVYGANTYVPFDAGSARIVNDGNLLFVRTCHTMYKRADSQHHQANVTLEFNTKDMTMVDYAVGIANITYGYVSHSFNQFILLDEGRIVAVDHGDAYPRSVVLQKYNSDYSSEGFEKSVTYAEMLEIAGAHGANATGVSIGGFEMSSGHYLVAGNTVSMDEETYDASGTKNIFVASVDRDLSESPVIRTLTSYKEGDTSPSTPQFVKIGEDSFLLMWTKDGVLNYCKIGENGKKVGKIYTMDADLSDCVPIVTDGKLVWYTWDYSFVDFYEIDLTNLSKTNVYQRLNGEIQTERNIWNTSVTLSKASFTYDGEAKKPKVTVKYFDGKDISSKYYKVTYKDNTKVGTATVTVKFKGDYSGTLTTTFKIKPAATTISKVTSAKTKTITVKWKKQTTQTTGYEIQYATDKKFTKNKTTVTVSSAKTTSKTITGLSAKKTYYVRIRTYKTISGTKYCSAWSGATSVTTK